MHPLPAGPPSSIPASSHRCIPFLPPLDHATPRGRCQPEPSKQASKQAGMESPRLLPAHTRLRGRSPHNQPRHRTLTRVSPKTTREATLGEGSAARVQKGESPARGEVGGWAPQSQPRSPRSSPLPGPRRAAKWKGRRPCDPCGGGLRAAASAPTRPDPIRPGKRRRRRRRRPRPARHLGRA